MNLPKLSRLLLMLPLTVSIAGAQCYVFTSSAAQITVTANISITSQTVVISSAAGRLINFNYNGNYTETVGGTTVSGSGPTVNASVAYSSSLGGAVPHTDLIMGSSTQPGSSAVANGVLWSVSLNGTGDLLPNGLTPTLPPISAWQYDPGNGVTPPGNILTLFLVPKPMYVTVDGISSCASGSSYAKALGNPYGLPGCIICGEPINIGTGNVVEQVADYKTIGADPLALTRYYNSMAGSTTFAKTLGANWRSNYDRYLNIGSSTAVTAERADGQQLNFTLTNGAWTTDSDVDVKLTNSGANWTLTDRNDTVESYTVAAGANKGVLQTIRARSGYTQMLQYGTDGLLTAVTDSFNRQLSFTYSGGLLQTVTTPDGVVLTYGYSGGNLASISYPTSPLTSQTYLYENTAFPNALTGIIDENGNRFTSWTYDSKGRALSSQHAGGADLVQVAYNDTDGSRTVTNPLGEQETYKFSTLQGVPKVTEVDRLAIAGLPAATRKFTYDSNGYAASQTDWNGNLTSYVNDTHGQPTSIIEAAGSSQARTVAVTYHPTFHLPAKVVTPGLTTSFTYDTNGELLTSTLTDTTTTTAPYSTAGQSRIWTYTWSNFQLASIKKPRTDVNGVTTLAYDGNGALASITNALGQTIQLTQNMPGGLPQTIVDANGVTTNLTYDPRLRLLSSTVSTGAGALTTSYSYDAAEQRLGIILPDGSALARTYDNAHRLTGLTDVFGQTIAYTLDAQGDLTQGNVTDANGNLQRSHAGVFDALGRLLQDIGAAGQTTNYAWDSNGNPLTVTDPLKHATQRTFDALNRAVTITDPAKGIARTSYDSYNRPLTVTDANGGVTTFVYDGFGEVIERVSPDSGTTIYHYDSDGNQTQRVDGTGATTNYSYDALDRVVNVSFPADSSENVVYTYDQGNFGVGRLTSITDAAGTLSRTYDEQANLLSETRINGAATLTTLYTYDVASRLTSITYPSGWMAAYTHDAMGRIITITAQAPGGASPPVPVVGSLSYQPFGPANGFMFGNGIIETRTFDLDYRLTNLADSGTGPLQNLGYAYDAGSNVSSITDGVTATNSQTLGYDALNRLTSAAGAYGSLGYEYDPVGNRLSESTGSLTAVYGYSTKSNQLSTVTGAGTLSIGYDKSGNINSFNNPQAPGSISSATYNQAGQMATVMAGNNTAAQYTYDAFGRRLRRVGAITGTTLYQYDRNGHLLEETDEAGNPLADYIYLGGLPVATISPSTSQVYFLHTDRLGTPQAATDSGQNIVWSASYGPFGETIASPGTIVQDLRLPGQEFDVETGFNHNGFRDYVPAWGRYLQSDPIGLAGGLNTYGYAAANPLRSFDPMGLCLLSDLAEDVVDWFKEKVQDKVTEPLNELVTDYVQADSREAGQILAAEDAVAGPVGTFELSYEVTKQIIDASGIFGPDSAYFPSTQERLDLQTFWALALLSHPQGWDQPAPAPLPPDAVFNPKAGSQSDSVSIFNTLTLKTQFYHPSTHTLTDWP